MNDDTRDPVPCRISASGTTSVRIVNCTFEGTMTCSVGGDGVGRQREEACRFENNVLDRSRDRRDEE